MPNSFILPNEKLSPEELLKAISSSLQWVSEQTEVPLASWKATIIEGVVHSPLCEEARDDVCTSVLFTEDFKGCHSCALLCPLDVGPDELSQVTIQGFLSFISINRNVSFDQNTPIAASNLRSRLNNRPMFSMLYKNLESDFTTKVTRAFNLKYKKLKDDFNSWLKSTEANSVIKEYFAREVALGATAFGFTGYPDEKMRQFVDSQRAALVKTMIENDTRSFLLVFNKREDDSNYATLLEGQFSLVAPDRENFVGLVPSYVVDAVCETFERQQSDEPDYFEVPANTPRSQIEIAASLFTPGLHNGPYGTLAKAFEAAKELA